MLNLYNMQITQTETDRHDTSGTYLKLTIESLQLEIPEFDWQLYLRTILQIKLPEEELVVSYAMSYFTQLGHLLKKTDKRYLNEYIIINVQKYIKIYNVQYFFFQNYS